MIMPDATTHPTATGVAVNGPPPSPGARASGPLFGVARSKPSRRHLEAEISSLTADLNAAKAQCAAAERDLQEEQVRRHGAEGAEEREEGEGAG